MADPWNMKHWRKRAAARKRQVKAIPKVFNYRTLLYIGANPERIEMVDLFLDHGYTIDVLEIFRPNAEGLRRLNSIQRIFRNIYEGDVRDLLSILPYPRNFYDIVMFWHGLEHLPKDQIKDTVKGIERVARHLVIFGCPIGEYEQEEVDGNIHEKHLSFLDEEFFRRLGYQTSAVRKDRPRGSNLCAWKVLDG